MPTFTAIALDSLIEPGAPKSMAPSNPKLERRNSTPTAGQDMNPKLERGVSVPPSVKLDRGLNIPPNPRNGRRNSEPTSTTTSVVDKKYHWTQISPALYTTPESTPLPDSPSSFPPSPYIINHKRRGPRLSKSFSDDDVATCEQSIDDVKVDGTGKAAEMEIVSVAKDKNVISIEVVESTVNDNVVSDGPGDVKEKYANGAGDEETGNIGYTSGSASQNGVPKSVAFDLQQNREVDDFFDPQDSMSVKSLGESESNGGAEQSLNSTTPLAEFYDAWEELSSESGPQISVPDFENELRETRLSLLMEIEKRKQAEETLNSMRNQWQRIRQQFSLVGLTLPEDPKMLHEGEQAAEEVIQQVYLARFVSNSIGRGMAKAEVEMEMEAQIKLKNSEIARLWDRLHYYEAVNQEMSQRNQEVVETARRVRQRRRRRQRWIWGSVATLVTLGSAAFAYSYFQSGKGSSSPTIVSAPEIDHKSK